MIDGALVDDMLDAGADDSLSATPTYNPGKGVNPAESMPTLRKVIERRVCQGKRLQITGSIYGETVDGIRWRKADVVAEGTVDSMGTRWIRRDKKTGSWIVRSVRP